MRRLLLALLPVAVAVVAAVVAVAAVSAGDDGAPERSSRVGAPPVRSPSAVPTPRPAARLFAVRRPSGIRGGTVARLARARGVVAVTPTGRAQVLLRRSTTAGGRVVDAAPAGSAFPLDALVVDARAYRRVVPAAGALRRGTAVLSRTSARVRRLRPGDRLVLAGGRVLRVVAVVGDAAARDAEVVVSRADVPPLEGSAQALVAARHAGPLRDALPRDGGATRLIRLGGARPPRAAVARAVQVKDAFGEFAVRLPYAGDTAEIDPRWTSANVVTRDVPPLGAVTCHRRVFAPLRRALRELARSGLGGLATGYAGCFVPKRIPGSGALSLHAWGLALDLATDTGHPDRRLVHAMERAGFTWGGRWPTAPDPVHFELHGR